MAIDSSKKFIGIADLAAPGDVVVNQNIDTCLVLRGGVTVCMLPGIVAMRKANTTIYLKRYCLLSTRG